MESGQRGGSPNGGVRADGGDGGEGGEFPGDGFAEDRENGHGAGPGE